MSSRLEPLDRLRGIAILAVLLSHVCLLVGPDAAGAWIVRGLDHLTRFAVPLFLGIPAFLALWRPRPAPDLGPWLARRLHVILAPFLAWSAIYAFTPHIWGIPDPALPLPLRVLLGYTEPHLYFVPVYLGMMPLVALLQRAAARPPRWLPWLLSAGVAAGWSWRVASFAWHRAHSMLSEPVWADPRMPMFGLAAIGLGGLLALALRGALGPRAQRLLRAPWLVGASTTAWLLLCAPWRGGASTLFHVAPSFEISAVLALPGLWWLVTGPLARASSLAWLGRGSFAFYLAHMLGLVLVAGLCLGTMPLGLVVLLSTLGGLAAGLLAIPVHKRVFLTT